MSPKRSWLALCLAILAGGCGGKSNDEKKVERSGPTGLRIYRGPGSTPTVTASVYGGPVPTDSWAVAEFPTNNGYVLLGTVGAGSGPVDFPSAYPYFLIKVKFGVVSLATDPNLRVDAIQRIPDGMYMTGRTYTGYGFYSTGTYDDDKIGLSSSGEDYWVGPPDPHSVAVFGWALLPTLDWAP